MNHNIQRNIENSLIEIWNYILKIDEWIEAYLQDNNELEENDKRASEDTKQDLAKEIRVFVSDRLNEIRYLFKSEEYQYEKELRMIRCSRTTGIDRNENFQIPRLYIEVDKEIRNLEVKLGSKLSPQEIREISTWLYGTGKVKKVTMSEV